MDTKEQPDGHTKGPCSCMSDTNKMLGEEHNTILAFTFGTPSRAVISTMKLDPSKRGKPVAMIASFCPFCGESYACEARS